jgi:hypothetical protein
MGFNPWSQAGQNRRANEEQARMYASDESGRVTRSRYATEVGKAITDLAVTIQP